ncbi:MAG: DNA repair protein RadA [Acidimicrobiia bacterium]
MAKTKTVFRCTDCGSEAPKWVGRCSGCGEWNTLVEELDTPFAVGPVAVGGFLVEREPPVPIDAVADEHGQPVATGIPELDRVLGGGLVAGSVSLLGGEPGVGKSTLLLMVAAARALSGQRVLYVSAEESKHQIRARAERLGAVVPNLWLSADCVVPAIVSAIDEVKPDLVIVDSIQTVADPSLSGAPGSVGQVRECAYRLVREAKQRNVAMVLVGHVTKDGALAGPRVLEHIVDTVLSFEGERHHALRLLRAVKHRFGPTGELGVFEMGDAGLRAVNDPSALFLADRRRGVAGSVVTATLEGQRPILAEVQGLVVASPMNQPRRSTSGLDNQRLAMLIAVLDKRTGVRLAQHDVYVSTVGGARLIEPGTDLAVALALVSSASGAPVGDDIVVCGEVGLGGELRQVGQTPRRLAEAARLGFRRAIVPPSVPDCAGIEVIRTARLAQAIAVAGLTVSATLGSEAPRA